jgi:putative transposase
MGPPGLCPANDTAEPVGAVHPIVWKKKYAHLGASELRELRQLREENAKLKHLVADLTLDKHIMAEITRKKA